ncbi:MAG TPA: hypothetical protein VF815_31520 [Myxococcaceae bacterium]|jgi:tetratricopeptide (TPR) repeat protein
MWGLVGTFGVALAGGAVLGVKSRQRSAEPVKPVEPPRPRQQDRLFQQAKNHIRENRWHEARASLLELRSVAPDSPGLPDYLDLVDRELPNADHLSAAQTALAEKNLAVAQAELEKISPDTRMFEQVVALKRELRNAEEAQQLEAEEDMSCDFRATPPPAPVDPWQQAVAVFKRQDLKGAAALARACASRNPRCKSGLKELEEFNKLAGRLDRLKAQELRRLLTLHQQLTENSGSSPLFTLAAFRVSEVFYSSALEAKAKGQWTQAMRDVQTVLQADPSHAGAATLLSELRARAKDFFLRGYAFKDSDPSEAREYFQRVIALTPPDDEAHQKAQAWLRKLQ